MNRTTRRFVFLAVIAVSAVVGLVAATGHLDRPALETSPQKADYRRDPHIPHPDDNALTPDRVRLGRTLFFDPRLSGSQWISCATCHNPGFAWTDGLPRAIGHGMQQLGRRTPTILNLAWAPALFWDGRAESLEEQALGPIQAKGEMNLSLDQMVERLRHVEGYGPLFAQAYPVEPISEKTVAKAIATYERTVISSDAPFDRWIAGDERAISNEAKRGFDLFNNKARCSTCHSGWRFTDDSFHDIGVAGDDIGRGKVTPTLADAQHAFKTPTLRNVVERAPYMHDGSAATLADVIDLYDRGGLVRRASLSQEINALNLGAAEKHDLIAFLRTLSSQDEPVHVPALPR